MIIQQGKNKNISIALGKCKPLKLIAQRFGTGKRGKSGGFAC